MNKNDLSKAYKRGTKRGTKRTIEDFILLAKEKHGNAYDYDIAEYVNSVTKIDIMCNIHGIFKQRPAQHLSGGGCPACGNIRKSLSKIGKKRDSYRLFDIETFIQRAKLAHADTYDYSKSIYKGNCVPLVITCPTHGDFMKRPDLHWGGSGCPNCRRGKQYSSKSDKWLDEQHVWIREYRLPENKLRVVDGYDPKTNTVYQFHGDFWHGNPKTTNHSEYNPVTKETFGDAYKRTCKLDQEILDYGYNLIVCWENKITKDRGE